MKIDVKSRYKQELNSFILISCCTKATQDFFIVTKSRIFGQAGFWGGSGAFLNAQIQIIRSRVFACILVLTDCNKYE